MSRSKKTQLLTLSFIATLISLIPFLSSSLKSTYLYFIINVLIIVLGYEAGFLSSSSSNMKIKKPGVENSTPEKKIVVCGDEVKKMIKKCPSNPSMFFIGGDESEAKVVEKAQEIIKDNQENEEEENERIYEEEELFEKAESFIVNFYKQLKMQREESLNKIYDFNDNGLVVN